MKRSKTSKLLKIFLGLILITGIFVIVNKAKSASYEKLADLDKAIFDQYKDFAKSDGDIWQDYNLKDKDIVAVNGKFFGEAYLFTKDSNIKSIFAKKVDLPEDYGFSAYRIAKIHPKRYISGNFNTHGKKYSILGKENIFFVKYNDDSVNKAFTSNHFLPFLAHEAFHYYMQDGWTNDTFRGLSYNEDELALLDKEYQVLDKIDQELKGSSDKEKLILYVKEYIDVMDQRFESTDAEKIKAEINEELVEGTAQYLTIKASQIVNYDYGILYFDNTKDVRFKDIVPTIKFGQVDQSIIGDRIVYDSGALLCELLDSISTENWQEVLNNKKDEDIYLYQLIKSAVDR